MKIKNANTRNAELAQIHIAKKELGLDDDTYRAVLWTCARVTSSKDLDFSGRIAVLNHFKARGWKNHAAPKVADQKKKMISKIAALLADMQLTWAYAEGIAKQMYKREKLEWCKPAELRGIVAALVNKQKKQHPQGACPTSLGAKAPSRSPKKKQHAAA